MPTKIQEFSVVNGGTVHTAGQASHQGDSKQDETVTQLNGLDSDQAARVAEAVALWDDVSEFTGIMREDDSQRATDTLTKDPDSFLWWQTGSHYRNVLSNDWTRVVLGNIAGSEILGVNKDGHDAKFPDSLYHEVFIDQRLEGIDYGTVAIPDVRVEDEFQLGSASFTVLLHELGHSILGHTLDPKLMEESSLPGINGAHFVTDNPLLEIMGPSEASDRFYDNGEMIWHASTPMTLDIDYASSLYGRALDTRNGDDTYGFNAHFSGDPETSYRAAFDFDVNLRPLVTIFDNGGNDTLDASGFKDAITFAPRAVLVDLAPGGVSQMIGGGDQYFAVIYQSTIWNTETWIENAVGGAGNDQLNGNIKANTLKGGAGSDTLRGREGNDIIEGGPDADTAVYGGYRAEYTISGTRKHFTITDSYAQGDGTDTVNDVEFLEFADGTFAVSSLIASVAPKVAAMDLGVRKFGNLAASSLVSVSDADGDAITQYRFWDASAAATSGHFTVNGVAQGVNKVIEVSAAQLAQTRFEAGKTADDLWVQVYDGEQWSDWKEFHLTPPANIAPDVAVADLGVRKNGSLAASSLFSASDADGDAITQYRFWDASAAATSGHFTVNGVAQGVNKVIEVSAGQLAQTRFDTGTTEDDLWVQAFDGETWSAWKEFHLTPPANILPDLTAVNRSLGENTSVAVSTLFSASDADGDAITTYRFWDSTATATSGHFAINGMAKAANVTIEVNAAQLAQTTFQTGTTADSLWVQVSDGKGWSAWQPFTVTPIHAVTGNLTLIGTAGADTLTGAAGNDRIEGREGNDVLTGGAGADQLIGGSGTDFLWVDAQDTLIDGGEGFDYVYLDYTQSGGQHFIVAGTNTECINGTMGNDVIDASGVTYDTVLFGNYGADVLIGGAGRDGLMGSVDNDTLTGGTGNDIFYFGDLWGKDRITDFAHGQDVLDMTGVSGLTNMNQLTITDTAQGANIAYGANSILLQGVSATSMTPADFHFSVATIAGTEGADVLTGDGSSNRIMALGGDDTLIGKGGADVLDGGTGIDTADYSASSAGVSVNLVTGIGHGGDAEGDTLISIEHVVGSAFVDAFQGGADRGQFIAGDGDDTMTGGSVYDWLEGGKGNDTFVGTGGSMVMFGGDGNDKMTGSLNSYNYIDGGLGNDVMTGGNTTDYMADVLGGDDIMHAGGGDDSLSDFYGVSALYGEGGKDFISASGGSGLLDGGADNDYLTASNGTYTMKGGDGNDTLEFAGTGSATYTGGAGSDIFTYRVGAGPIGVTDFQDGIDFIYLWDNHNYGTVPFESLTISDNVAGVDISWNGGSHMVLAGIHANQLTQQDFLLTI